jgi:hypothetical protein
VPLTRFHERLMALLPGVVAAALGPDFVGGADAVYGGRRPETVRVPSGDVFVEELGRRPATGAYRAATEHRYRLWVRTGVPAGARGTGKLQADLVGTRLAALGETLGATRPSGLAVDLPEVLSTRLEVEAQDQEPDDRGECSGTALFSVFTRGTGDA